MGWHDSKIYRIRYSTDLELDIDYILQWNKPDIEGLPFTFWVVPATLVFKEIQNLEFEIDAVSFAEIEIENIERTVNDGKQLWTVITRQGDFEFESSGYVQYMRQEPFYQFGQSISYQERNGYSLKQTTNQENSIRDREDVFKQRENNLAHYETAKLRHLKKQEKVKLEKQWAKREIESKAYLQQKREIKDKIEFYDHWLKNTIFENW